MIKNKNIFNLIVGSILIIFGIFLWLNPAKTLVDFSLLLGIIYLAIGVGVVAYYLVNKFKPLPWGNILLTFLVGCVILASPTLTLTIVLWVFIAGFIITAIYYFLKFYKDKDRKYYSNNPCNYSYNIWCSYDN